MRKYFIAGNWKMNPLSDPLPLLRELKVKLVGMNNIDLVVAPPFTALHQASELLRETPIIISAQHLFWEEKGAFTGEISASMLKVAGADYVIIGHSERRQYFSETDHSVNLRLKTALNNGLTPILCLGETEDERERGITFEVIERQFKGALSGCGESDLPGFIIAYEPVWAIGTGKTAQPADAQEVHEFLRRLLRDHYSSALADTTRIIYGGSVKPDNAAGLFKQVDIDGALVGGASLSAESFAQIAKASMELV
ncbi:MAG: triose-phosphate isomerase [candidate division Zixibacteria bacterium]|nr:triose-phosphate isomerase [Candidatus Tariuqbacter arcticus]